MQWFLSREETWLWLEKSVDHIDISISGYKVCGQFMNKVQVYVYVHNKHIFQVV